MGPDHAGIDSARERRSGGNTDLIAIAYILGAHGVRGYVRIQPLTDSPGRFATGLEVVVTTAGDDRASVQMIEDVIPAKRGLAVKLTGVEVRNDAERLRGGYLKVPRTEAPPLPDGRYYVFDIVGLEVFTTDERRIGRVSEVLETGANDVYVIEPAEGGKDILIPAVKQVVKRIDLDSRRMVIEPLEGLI